MTLEKLRELIDEEINQLELKYEPINLYHPISYILSLGGKRIRPMMVLMGYSLFKNDPEKIVNPALAVEVFHNFTLMHDDIMDKAPIRRGKLSVHEKWNENVAILSGDTMMIQAYKLLEGVSQECLPQALKLFNECALKVCEGQQMDMDFEKQVEVSAVEYLEMIRLKTAVLLGFSLRLGGLLAGADNSEQRQLQELGLCIGMAFQLMDDHLDSFGNSRFFGKQIGGDILANKKTFLLISTMALSPAEKRIELTSWLRKSSFDNQEKIDAVKSIYLEVGAAKASLEKIRSYESKALEILNTLDGNPDIRKILGKYLTQLKQRAV